jgi:fucose 4-O-acetylase-like acetyltransferase
LRQAWVDCVRGVAIVLVVVGHVIQFGSQERFDFFTNPVFIGIYAFHMPLFAVVSGYLTNASLQRQSRLRNLRTRTRTLLLPYATWTLLLGSGLYWASTSAAKGGISEGFHYVARFAFLASGSLWFLLFLFISYIILALATSAQKLVGWAALPVSIVVVWLIPLGPQLAFFQVKWLYPFVVLGFLAHGAKRRLDLARWEKPATVISILLFILLLQFWTRQDSVYISQMQIAIDDPLSSVERWPYRYLLATSGVIAVTGIVRIALTHTRLRVFEFLGRASLGIYSVQTVLVLVLAHLPSPSADPFLYFGVYVPVVSAIIVVVSYVLTIWVLQKMALLRILLLGGKRSITSRRMPRHGRRATR